MKKHYTYFLVASFAISGNCFSQLKKNNLPPETIIGTAKTTGIRFSELSYYLDNGDTTYIYKYKDKTYSQLNVWESVFFKGGSQTLTDLYSTLKSGLDSAKGYTSSFTLGKTDVLLKSSRMAGTKYISLAFSKEGGGTGITDLTGRQIDNLFNRKEETAENTQ